MVAQFPFMMFPPPLDALHHTFDSLNRNEVVKVVAMSPYDQLVPDELKRHFPGAEFEVIVWPTENRTVAEMADWATRIRGMKPQLVIPAVPLPSLSTQQEVFIAEYEWVLNWSFQFAGRPWDVIPVMPLETDDTTESQHRNLANARRSVLGKDVGFIERAEDDHRTVAEVVSSWITAQKRTWQGARNILPTKNDSVLIPTESCPHRPGPRSAARFSPLSRRAVDQCGPANRNHADAAQLGWRRL